MKTWMRWLVYWMMAAGVSGAELVSGCDAELIAGGFKFTEGPVWIAALNSLVFSDINGNALHRWNETDGVSVFRQPSFRTNGNTLDPQGRLVSCRHEARDVVRTEPDGSLTVLASSFQGGRLNSPNDVAVRADGTVWFTDPGYGLNQRPKEQPFNAVYRLDPGASEPAAVITDLGNPNGLAFSPDGRFLYVSDSGGKHGSRRILRYRLHDDGSLSGGDLFASVESGAADGLRVDGAGRLFCTGGIGVEVFDPEGRRLAVIRTPKPASNCCFGGPDGKVLFITARDAVYRALPYRAADE